MLSVCRRGAYEKGTFTTLNTTRSLIAMAQATDCMIKPNKDVLVFYLLHLLNPNLLDSKELDLEVQGRAGSSAHIESMGEWTHLAGIPGSFCFP
jgi:hypothetical protein